MRIFALPAILLVMLASGCTSGHSQHTNTKSMPGSDRDEQGCIGSAGYLWCERTGRCERPWELADQQGFDNTQEQFDAFCSGQ
ncbi:serine protease [Aestuariirhabdus sp. Z084]|uniref:serine protease n=1 Tax=Aestuariirhabdus haliotis TaxID=2918751 RepID=UPI00201B3610|nr:serine protease [Aestuariirhabdus haliotis]MCL6417726.1 serine protease [Aestuariirhabdus haliotis]MCL6421669.1 serine protease [Aestuariirhabdus haliotis]